MGQRYQKQVILEQIGQKGQKKLSQSSVLIAGCGGLGCLIADFMVRAGIGKITLVDRDVVELDNLHRQILFDEGDAKKAAPKALAASEKLKKANSEVDIKALVADISPVNVEEAIQDADLVLDGTDNFETRFFLNDACLKKRIPWVYGGVVATRGMCLAVIPGKTPCLRCFLSEPPPPGEVPTCETVGVLGPAVAVIASLEVSEGLKILMGKNDELLEGMVNFDIWTGDWELFKIKKNPECPACSQGEY
ncbi:MAG: HesA/MoeB/ThiF family protein, partial [Acidobacteriota bacterium]